MPAMRAQSYIPEQSWLLKEEWELLRLGNTGWKGKEREDHVGCLEVLNSINLKYVGGAKDSTCGRGGRVGDLERALYSEN